MIQTAAEAVQSLSPILVACREIEQVLWRHSHLREEVEKFLEAWDRWREAPTEAEKFQAVANLLFYDERLRHTLQGVQPVKPPSVEPTKEGG